MSPVKRKAGRSLSIVAVLGVFATLLALSPTALGSMRVVAKSEVSRGSGMLPRHRTASDFNADAVGYGVIIDMPNKYVDGKATPNSDVRLRLMNLARTVTYDTKTVRSASNGFYQAVFDSSFNNGPGNYVQIADLGDSGAGSVRDIQVLLQINVDADTEVVSGLCGSNVAQVDVNAGDGYLDRTVSSKKGVLTTSAPPDRAYTTSFAGRSNIAWSDCASVIAYTSTTLSGADQIWNRVGAGASVTLEQQHSLVRGYSEFNSSPQLTVVGKKSLIAKVDRTGYYRADFSSYARIANGDRLVASLSRMPWQGVGKVDLSTTVGEVTAGWDLSNDLVEGVVPKAGARVRVVVVEANNVYVRETTSDITRAYSADFRGLVDLTNGMSGAVEFFDGPGVVQARSFAIGPSWYLPEGTTRPGFETYVLIQNPSAADVAKVDVEFNTNAGFVQGPKLDLDPMSRATVFVNDYVHEDDVSTRVISTNNVPVVAERAVYINTPDGKWGAHDSIGSSSLSPMWFLAEGTTYTGFDEWVLIQNPNPVPVTAEVCLLGKNGKEADVEVELAAETRKTIHVNDMVPPDSDVSTIVEVLTPNRGVVAERAMYMNTADGKRGAHDSIGVDAMAPDWFLPEGTTWPGFDEWVLVSNPNKVAVGARVTFLGTSGPAGEVKLSLAPSSRQTVHVNEVVPPGLDISTMVHCTTPGRGVVAERAVYMNTVEGQRDAHDSVGSEGTSSTWYLPEGTTRPGFDEWVLVANPNSSAVRARITFMAATGKAGELLLDLPAASRQTVHVNDAIASGCDVSTMVECLTKGKGVVAERAMYMNSPDGLQGAHDSIGIRQEMVP